MPTITSPPGATPSDSIRWLTWEVSPADAGTETSAEHRSNLAAMVTHVRRESGVDPVPLRLPGTDWVPHNADVPAAMGQNFIYL
ncbi:hypothetical protein ACVWXU_005600 [Streptomyces sp. TE33382]